MKKMIIIRMVTILSGCFPGRGRRRRPGSRIMIMEGTLMKKRLIALLLVLLLLIPAGLASAATWYRVSTTSLRVRFEPSESASVLGSYRQDYALTIQKKSGDWAYVKFSNGFQGYVQSRYITKSSSYSAWITNDETPMRSGPDGSFGITAKLAKGRKVTVRTHGSRYDYISAGDLGSGYVMNGFLSKKKVAASGNASTSTAATGGGYDAWVLNAGYRKVNLRTNAFKTAPIIAQYSTGTKVRVLEHGTTWDKVQVGGNTGYMMNSFLTTAEPAPTPTPAPAVSGGGTAAGGTYTAYVVTSNKKALNARKGESENYSVQFKIPYGAPVTVLHHGLYWDRIQYGGKQGYVKNNFLQLTKPADAAAPTADPASVTPRPAFQPYPATIYSANGKSVNVHKQAGTWASNVDGLGDNGRLPVGTTVTVLGVSKGWAKISYQGKEGWVMTSYLK